MPNIKSFPNNQDEYVGAEYVMKWLHGRTSGVFAAENNASVNAVSGRMAVNVSDGYGWIANGSGDGICWWIDAEKQTGSKLVLEVDMADSVRPRIDRVVVTWQTTNYVALPTITILKGTPNSAPAVPALINNSSQRQISLARIKVPAGITAITASMITDERFNPEVCGLVTESVSADLSMINAQFEELLTLLEKQIDQTAGGAIPDGAVTTPKLKNGAVTEEKLADAVLDKINTAGVKIVKLWENASSGSDFAGQTITNSQFSKCSFFIIVMSPMSCILPAGTAQILSTNYQAGSLDYTMSRRVDSSGDRIVFADAKNKSSSYGWKTNNSVAKPMAIYGIK